MSFDNVNHHVVTLPASGDLSTKQYCGVTVNSSGQAAIADTDDQVIGVLQNKPTAAGQGATVAWGGVSKMTAGGSITAGARVTTDASGKAVAAATAGDSVIGVALASGSSGDVIAVLLKTFPFAALA